MGKILNLSGLLVIGLIFIVSACAQKYPGVPEKYHDDLDAALQSAEGNKGELETALAEVADSQKEAMAFLIVNMPQRDLESLSSEFLKDNVS